MKKTILTLLAFSFLFSQEIQVDYQALQKSVEQNPQDVKNRLVLASYYLKTLQVKKAKKLLSEILKIDPNNKKAKELLYNLKLLKNATEYKKFFSTPNKYISLLYDKKDYKNLMNFFEYYTRLNGYKKLSDDSIFKAARVFMWEGKYQKSLNALKHAKNKKSLDYYEIIAYDLYYLGDPKAEKYLKILYNSTGNIEYAKTLLDFYLINRDIPNAKKLLLSLSHATKNKKLIEKYKKKIAQIESEYINDLYQEYKNNPTFTNLKKLVLALYDTNKEKAYSLLQEYIKNNPADNQAKIFFAQILTWDGDTNHALKYLKEFHNNVEAKLLIGKILAWQGNYDKAAIYLSDVYDHGNPKEKYEALKMLGFIAMWKNDNLKAKEIFKRLLKQNPNDEEVKEALMILNGNIKPVIAKYEKLLKREPDNAEYILKLADLYYMDKNYQKSAYYYEKYLKYHPEKIEVYKTLGDIYLELKNYYKGFGDWEYYANYKNTKEAYLELAQRYYWNGFNKEALKVLDELLKQYPDFKEAAILKAKILKINPRFVDSSSAATIDEYYNNRAQKLLVYGDRAYFNNLFATAKNYYHEYLSINPDNYEVREKYAYTLEKTGDYANAAGEFFLLMWNKKTPLIEYHYAYNLQKSGKLQEAKKIYKKLLNTLPKPLPANIEQFLQEWKKAWESMDFNKYAKFYDKKISNNVYWRLRKENIFKNAGFISVGIYSPLLIKKEGDVYVVKFYQVYASQKRKDKGYKTIWIKCKNDKCKIIKEKWQAGEYTPYNPTNSLEKYIKENLNKIKKKQTPKLEIVQNLVKQPDTNKKENEKKYFKENNLTKNIQIIPIKKNIVSTKNQQKVLPWQITTKYNFYHDTQKTTMHLLGIKIFKNNKSYSLFGLYKWYHLKEKGTKSSYLAGIGYKNDKFTADIFYDTSTKKSIGFDFYTKVNHLNLFLNKHNMVYSRRTVCSTNHIKIKAEITKYTQLDDLRGLWWSLAYERVDDSNNIFTPQIDYDFYEFNKKTYTGTFYFSGWYQFNSKTTSCYYSPKKTDANIIGIKLNKNLNQALKTHIQGGIGYSFWDKTYLYSIKGYIKNINTKKLYTKLGCKISNSSSSSVTTHGFQSIECLWEIDKKW
ncbi:tetratricopeptide repeat protein [Caminibacter pacificus]